MISIIVTVYNTKQYLPACIESIMKQDYQDFEILLIDDGSEKETADMCDEYSLKDSRIKVFHQENRGIGGAKNSGLDYAKGEYILFVDSDDTIPENHLPVLKNAIEVNKADLAIGSLTFVPGPTVKHRDCIWNNHQLMEQMLYRNGIRDVSVSKLYKRELFDAVRFTENIFGEDFEIFYRLFSQVRTATITDKTTYYYYQYGSSISNSGFSEKRFKRIEVCEDLQKNIARDYPDLQNALNACLTDEAINMYTITPAEYSKEKEWALNVIKNYGRDVIRDSDASRSLKRKTRLFLINPGLWRFRMYAKRTYIRIKQKNE